jgi:hypothetical protein
MPSEAMTLATDRTADRLTKRCTNCGKWKARDEFVRDRTRRDQLHIHCKQCQRNRMYARYHEGGGKEAQAAYHARPEVKARRRDRELARREDVKQRQRKQRRERGATPRGKFLKARSNARERLKRATTDEQRSRLVARIAACDRELARIDARKAAERAAELPAEPVPPASDCNFRGVHRTKHGTFSVLVTLPGKRQVRGGTHPTIEAARAEANRLGREHLGIDEYAVPKWRRRA